MQNPYAERTYAQGPVYTVPAGAAASTGETDATGAGPADDVALHVRDRDESIIESGQNVRDANADVLGVLGLDDFLLVSTFAQQFGSAAGAM